MDKSTLIQQLLDTRTQEVREAEQEVSRNNTVKNRFKLALAKQKLENVQCYAERTGMLQMACA